MQHKIAKALSYLFHPLFMATYSLFLLFNLDTYISYSISITLQRLLIVTSLFTTVIIPALYTWWLYKTNRIDDLEITDYNQRRLPYLITALAYTFNYYLIAKLPLPIIVHYVILGATLAVILTMIINLFWKISAHLVGIGGLMGMLVAVAFNMYIDIHIGLMIALLIAGLIGSARLYLQAHTQGQVYSGFCLGFICLFAIILLGN